MDKNENQPKNTMSGKKENLQNIREKNNNYNKNPITKTEKGLNEKSRKTMGWLIAVMMLLCIVIGGLLSVYVIVPAIEAENSDLVSSEKTEEDEQGILVQEKDIAEELKENQPIQTMPTLPPITTENPEIGGVAPKINAMENPIVQIAQEVSPAVVGVAVNRGGPSVLEPRESQSGYGTGIIISDEGYIVTNNHVIDGASSVIVTLLEGTEYKAIIVGADPTTDLAVLKINASGLKVAALGSSGNLMVGETVVAIGNPLGSDLAGSVTSGIISALNRVISTNGYSQRYIQTDAAINPGNSGGALVNIKGEVIGINTLKSYLAGYDDFGVPIGTDGIGFAIPIDAAKPIIEQLMRDGKVRRPGIGISCLVDVTNMYNDEDTPDGVTVVEVLKGGPASMAGLQIGDVITAVNSVAINTVEELTAIIKNFSIGEEIEITVWRDSVEYSAKVIIGDLNEM